MLTLKLNKASKNTNYVLKHRRSNRRNTTQTNQNNRKGGNLIGRGRITQMQHAYCNSEQNRLWLDGEACAGSQWPGFALFVCVLSVCRSSDYSKPSVNRHTKSVRDSSLVFSSSLASKPTFSASISLYSCFSLYLSVLKRTREVWMDWISRWNLPSKMISLFSPIHSPLCPHYDTTLTHTHTHTHTHSFLYNTIITPYIA